MLRRYRYKTTGPYSCAELRDIYNISQFLHIKVATGDNSLTELEKDYIRYSKQVFWHYTKYPTLLSCFVFLTADMVHPISGWRFFPRLAIKLVSSFWVLRQGANRAYDKILDFPMLDEVIGEGVAKYTEWVDLARPE
jgi:hypothetical protein